MSASSSNSGQGPRPPVKYARGLATKHHPLQAMGSVGLKHLARQDVAVGTHAHLTLRTQVWN
jgi:hypothetical protein